MVWIYLSAGEKIVELGKKVDIVIIWLGEREENPKRNLDGKKQLAFV
jgi:hypothetical protein